MPLSSPNHNGLRHSYNASLPVAGSGPPPDHPSACCSAHSSPHGSSFTPFRFLPRPVSLAHSSHTPFHLCHCTAYGTLSALKSPHLGISSMAEELSVLLTSKPAVPTLPQGGGEGLAAACNGGQSNTARPSTNNRSAIQVTVFTLFTMGHKRDDQT